MAFTTRAPSTVLATLRSSIGLLLAESPKVRPARTLPKERLHLPPGRPLHRRPGAWIGIAGDAVTQVGAAAIRLRRDRAVLSDAASTDRDDARVRIAGDAVTQVGALAVRLMRLRADLADAASTERGAGNRCAIATDPRATLTSANALEDHHALCSDATSARLRARIRVAWDTDTQEDTAALRRLDELAAAIRVAASTRLQRTRTLILARATPDNPTEVVAIVDHRRAAIVRPRGMVIVAGVVCCADAGAGPGSGHREPVHLEEPAVHRDAEGTCRPRARSGPRGIWNLKNSGAARRKVRVVVRRNIASDPDLECVDAGAGVVGESRDHPHHGLSARVSGDVRDEVEAGRW